MASYKVEWTRPTMELDNAGTAVKGYTVRITLYPWNEARDLFVKEVTAEAIKVQAELEIERRTAIDALGEIEVGSTKKSKKS